MIGHAHSPQYLLKVQRVKQKYCWFQLPLNISRSYSPLSGDNELTTRLISHNCTTYGSQWLYTTSVFKESWKQQFLCKIQLVSTGIAVEFVLWYPGEVDLTVTECLSWITCWKAGHYTLQACINREACASVCLTMKSILLLNSSRTNNSVPSQ